MKKLLILLVSLLCINCTRERLLVIEPIDTTIVIGNYHYRSEMNYRVRDIDTKELRVVNEPIGYKKGDTIIHIK